MHAAAKLTDMDSRLVLAAVIFLAIFSLSFAEELVIAQEEPVTLAKEAVMTDKIETVFKIDLSSATYQSQQESLQCKLQKIIIGGKVGGLLCPSEPPYIINDTLVYKDSDRGFIGMAPGLVESMISEKTQYMNYTYYPKEDNLLNISFVFDNEQMNYLTLEVFNGDKWVPVNMNKTVLEINGDELYQETAEENLTGIGKTVYSVHDIFFHEGDSYQMKVIYSTPETQGKYNVDFYQGNESDLLNGNADIFTELDPWYYTYNGIASGGTITIVGNEMVHTFTSNGYFVLSNGSNITTAKILVVGAGGGGGTGSSSYGSGGGGGGGGSVYNSSVDITQSNTTITVGAGGAANTNGGNSSFGGLINATGGGGATQDSDGKNGSSGAGGGATSSSGAAGGYGTVGGVGGDIITIGGNGSASLNVSSSVSLGGAGGGANASNGGTTNSTKAGNGGNGSSYTIYNGTAIYYGGGGGGAVGASTCGTKASGTGGTGGGGAGGCVTTGTAGTAGTGGGGGGSGASTSTRAGAAGGSGTVIIRYVYYSLNITYNSVTVSNGNTVVVNVSVNVSGNSTLDIINISLYDWDNNLIVSGASNISPYVANFSGLQTGIYTLNTTAYDQKGNYEILSYDTYNLTLNPRIIIAPIIIATNTTNITYNNRTVLYYFYPSGATTNKTYSVNITGVADNVSLLVIAGGGAGSGAGSSNNAGGGGGAGGVYYNSTYLLNIGNYSLFIGAGGVGHISGFYNGINSSFGSIQAMAGGAGGTYGAGTRPGMDGGSGGGGGGENNSAGGLGLSGQGNNGGYGNTSSNGATGGGGGAGAVGTNGINSPLAGGNGGNGISINITGTPIYYAGGGGGATGASGAGGLGGLGGGGEGGTYGSGNAANYYGGGGGGAGASGSTVAGGSGYAGIVILRYDISNSSDLAPPVIQFEAPTTNTSAGTTSTSIIANVTATDETALTNITIRRYSSVGAVLNTTNSTTSPLFVNYSGLLDGVYYWNATAWDTSNNTASTETRNVTIDTLNPTIQFEIPTDNSSVVVSRFNILSNVSATDTNLINVTTRLYNSGGALVNSSISNYNNFSGLSVGVYYLNATAYDLGGNFNDTETRNITVYTAVPSVTFVSPSTADGSTVFATQSISVNATATSLFNISNITIYFYNASGGLMYNITNYNTSFHNYSFSSLPNGSIVYYNATALDTDGKTGFSATRTITVAYFNISLVTYPADYATQLISLTNITYNITFIYPPMQSLNCTLFQDTSYKGSTGVLAGGIYNTVGLFDAGLHTWNISCTHIATSGVKSTSNLNVNIIPSNFSGTVYLSANKTVLAGSQALWYDQNEALNLIYFTNESGVQKINYYNINNSVISYNFTQSLNQTKAFFVAMRDVDSKLKLLTFSKDNSTYHVILINTTRMVINNYTDARFANVMNNSYYDPYRYAYTKHFSSLTLTANESSHVFMIPMMNQSVYVRMYAGNESIQWLYTVPYVGVNATSFGGAFTTIANESTLSNWIVNNYSVGLTAASNLSTYYINSTDKGLDNTKLLAEDTAIRMIAAGWNGTKIYYEQSTPSTYQVMLNSSHMKITRLEDMINASIYNASNPITNPSNFIFVDDDTFIFFSNETDGNIAYSCYFNTTTGNCTRIKENSYSQNITYYRGNMVTSDKSIFTNTVGAVTVDSTYTKLTFQSSIYDYKFRCYDEMLETRDPFSIQIYTDNSSAILVPQLYGYAASSGSFGTGTRKFYQTCYGGTNRLFLFGAGTAYPLSGYSLLIPRGQYFTFTVTTSMSNPILNATITATRFSPDNAAYVTIEQGLTDSQGKATLFLESNILYKMSIVADEYNPLTFDYVPINGSNYISAVMRTNATVIFNSIPVGYNNNIMYGLFPPPGNYNNTINLSFVIIDPDATLEYYGIDIYRRDSRGYETLWYNNTVYGQPYGGTITVNLPTNYSYRPYKYFKVFNQTEYHIIDDSYLIGSVQKAFAAIAEKLQDTGFIKGWYLYFIGIFFAMLSVGFVSKYSPEGAGVIGLIVLWGFTMFAPAAVILDMSIAGTPIQAWMVSTLTTVCVGAVMYLRQYWT